MGVSLCLNTERDVIQIRLYCKLHNTIFQNDKKDKRPVPIARDYTLSLSNDRRFNESRFIKANKY